MVNDLSILVTEIEMVNDLSILVTEIEMVNDLSILVTEIEMVNDLSILVTEIELFAINDFDLALALLYDYVSLALKSHTYTLAVKKIVGVAVLFALQIEPICSVVSNL